MTATTVNTKKWYRGKADLWAELGDKYHSAGKISSKESVKDACGRQCAIVRQKGCLQESFRECVVTWPDARKERVGGVYERDIGVGALI
jgi:hypothetical protein